ncbi:MAG: TA system VapC family ribonuclease toxin [Halofilum sp. (in: g-proteobacteria)]|nr:TA system VapC family ribonuclease toxin [Halofilum sp. (in: g-proteobacteria)]
MRALLDANVLIALLDESHTHHGAAMDWLAGEIDHGWASCPLTQNACVRIMAQPAYPGDFTPAEVAVRLGEAVADPSHAFWPADVSLLDRARFDWSHILGHRQVSDVYLLQLAVHNSGRFVTFDQHIPLDAVAGATEAHLVVVDG